MAARLACELQAIVGVGNVARINEVLKRVEVICAVEEECPALRKEQAKGVVDIELRRVGLNLREIWV